MAERDKAAVRARLYAKLYYVPTEVLDEKTVKHLKDMIKNTSCDICGKSFRAKFGKRIHMREVHNIMVPMADPDYN